MSVNLPAPSSRPRVKVEIEFTLFDPDVDADALGEAVFNLLVNDDCPGLDDVGDISVDGFDVTLDTRRP